MVCPNPSIHACAYSLTLLSFHGVLGERRFGPECGQLRSRVGRRICASDRRSSLVLPANDPGIGVFTSGRFAFYEILDCDDPAPCLIPYSWRTLQFSWIPRKHRSQCQQKEISGRCQFEFVPDGGTVGNTFWHTLTFPSSVKTDSFISCQTMSGQSLGLFMGIPPFGCAPDLRCGRLMFKEHSAINKNLECCFQCFFISKCLYGF